MERIIVEPVAGGWALSSDALDNLMVFRSGSAAERAGHDLARGLATAGKFAELQLRLKDGTRAAKFVCLPPTDSDPKPLVVGVRPVPRNFFGSCAADQQLATA